MKWISGPFKPEVPALGPLQRFHSQQIVLTSILYSRTSFSFQTERKLPSQVGIAGVISWKRKVKQKLGFVFYIRQVKGDSGQAPVLIPPLKQTNRKFSLGNGFGNHLDMEWRCLKSFIFAKNIFCNSLFLENIMFMKHYF